MATCSFVSRDSEDQEKQVLAKFSHGQLQKNRDGSWKNPPSFSLLKSSEIDDRRKKPRRILVAEADSMEYVGQNFGEHASKANSMCKYMVGVLDKKRGKMKVYDAQLLELHPWRGRREEEEEKKMELTYAQKKDRLTEAFGSSRKQRAMESRLKNKVGAEALQASASKALVHAESSPTTTVALEEEDDMLPPCDRNATKPQDVFKLEDLISPKHQQTLQPLAEELVDGAIKQAEEWRKTKRYPRYVLEHLPSLQRCPEERRNIQAVCLLYMSYLIQLAVMERKTLQAKSCLSGVPPLIRTHLLSTFTQMMPTPDGQHEKRSLPKRLKDRLVSYVLVLAQLVDSFHTDIGPLTEDLSLSVKKMIIHARAIGCSTTSQSIGGADRKRGIKLEAADYDVGGGASPRRLTFIELNAPLKKQLAMVGKKSFGGNR